MIAAYLLLLSVATLHVLFAVWPVDAEADKAPPADKGAAPAAQVKDGGAPDASAGKPPAPLVADARATAKKPAAAVPRDAGVGKKAAAAEPSPDGGARAADGKAAAAAVTVSDAGDATEKAKAKVGKKGARTVCLFGVKVELSAEILIVLLVAASGALGGLVHALRSFVWYVGNRFAYWSWTLKYMLQPLIASMLAILFYVVVRGGLFAGDSKYEQVNAFGFAGLACLIGMFSEQAALKLKDVAETFFTRVPRGAEALPQGNGNVQPPAPVAVLTIATLTPSIGVEGGGDTIDIQGAGFKDGATVEFGSERATTVVFVDAKTLRAVTPAHPAGVVDVKVVVDGSAVTRAGGFEYK